MQGGGCSRVPVAPVPRRPVRSRTSLVGGREPSARASPTRHIVLCIVHVHLNRFTKCDFCYSVKENTKYW